MLDGSCVLTLENGRGRIPPDRYLVWAAALGVEPRDFVRELMSYYDPMTYSIVFGNKGRSEQPAPSAGRSAALARSQRSKRQVPTN